MAALFPRGRGKAAERAAPASKLASASADGLFGMAVTKKRTGESMGGSGPSKAAKASKSGKSATGGIGAIWTVAPAHTGIAATAVVGTAGAALTAAGGICCGGIC